jgi:deazaflavin-dependent oxidoreductase (nitroreductase family)
VRTAAVQRRPGAWVRRGLWVQNRIVNRAVCVLLNLGLSPPTYALLETTGRRSGRPRQLPVANGLDGNTFWLIAGLGEKAQYVRNIKADPRVRIKARPARLRDGLHMSWRSGTAHLMPEDDAHARHHRLGRGRPGYRLDGVLLRGLSLVEDGQMLTVRIELDRPAVRGAPDSDGAG